MAAHNINVTVDEGETIGIIGANGAGKTTFVNMVTGYLPPSGGRIEFLGKSVVGLHPRDVTKRGLCRSFQVPQVFLSESIFDNMLVATAPNGRDSVCSRRSTLRSVRPRRCPKRYQINYRDVAAWHYPGRSQVADIAMAVNPKHHAR